ncbi:hypothetical protein [Heyndrickxia sporothermodurans]|uniref:hypothetical protein n=1 Tax=Heyndrickxia sporothermodurans TaxID=46224 RepID=UPI0035DF8162
MQLKEMLKLLVDAITKSEDSNVGKLFSIADKQLTDINDTLNKMEEWIDIENAQGKALDEIGADINQPRGQASDEIYRVMIRGKKARALSDGTINQMIYSLSKTLDCDPKQIGILSSIEAGEGEPSALIIRKIPIDALNKMGLSANQFIQFVEQVIPGDASLSKVSLDGTFSFGSGKNIETSDFGFADIKGTTGGTLSGVFIPGNDYKLPI